MGQVVVTVVRSKGKGGMFEREGEEDKERSQPVILQIFVNKDKAAWMYCCYNTMVVCCLPILCVCECVCDIQEYVNSQFHVLSHYELFVYTLLITL